MIRADIIYNNVAGREIAVALATRPSVPPPKMRGSWINLGAVDGSMLSTDYTYENITIEAQLNFVCPPEKVGNQYRRVKEWIRGSGELCFTDDPEVYYRVKAAQVAEYSRRTHFGADITAVFVCDPYAYLKAGRYPVTKEFPANNTGEHLYLENIGDTSRPIYTVTGSLLANASYDLSVNGKTVSCIRDYITIDTQKMAVYSETDTPPGLRNNVVDGDLDGLVLEPGTNDIQITGNNMALTLEAIPNWRIL